MDQYQKWNVATGELPWGVQRVIKDALQAVADEQITIIWGQDYSGNHACLINSVAQMLQTGGGYGIPMQHFGALVGMFDTINRDLYQKGVNTDHTVSPMAAEVLLRYFAPLREQPKATEAEVTAQMVEFNERWKDDEDFVQSSQDFANSLQVENGIKDFSNS